MYAIHFKELAVADLQTIRPFHRRRIVDALEEQLKSRPLEPHRNRKPLVGLATPWEQVRPVWQLRVGTYRVFYDVDEEERQVIIQAIRHKPAGKTTKEIL